jgi:protein-arginine kinase activator protein McsA
MEEYDRDAHELEENFKENQEKEKTEFESELETSIQGKVRPSSKLLNMKYRIEQLSKYQRFEEAAKLQDQYNVEVNFKNIFQIL